MKESLFIHKVARMVTFVADFQFKAVSHDEKLPAADVFNHLPKG